MTQIYSEEELVSRLWKSLDDVKNNRTMDAQALREKMKQHSKASVTV